jgi:protein-S-isoprenylcysteine O-methyltransferase Ste14
MINRIRVPLGFVVAAAVFYLATPTGVSILAGLPIAIAGAVFRMLAAGVIRKDARLATDGPYAWTRNPLYFGSSLLALGFAVMSANWIAAALLLVPSIFVYPTVIRNEEAHLERLFGEEFRAYQRKVPRFLPRFRSGFHGPFSFAQYWANREYNTALGLTAAVVLLVAKAALKVS